MLTDVAIRKLCDTLNAHPEAWWEIKAFMKDAVREANEDTTAPTPTEGTRDYYAGYEQGQKDLVDSLQKLKDRDAETFPQLKREEDPSAWGDDTEEEPDEE